MSSWVFVIFWEYCVCRCWEELSYSRFPSWFMSTLHWTSTISNTFPSILWSFNRSVHSSPVVLVSLMVMLKQYRLLLSSSHYLLLSLSNLSWWVRQCEATKLMPFGDQTLAKKATFNLLDCDAGSNHFSCCHRWTVCWYVRGWNHLSCFLFHFPPRQLHWAHLLRLQRVSLICLCVQVWNHLSSKPLDSYKATATSHPLRSHFLASLSFIMVFVFLDSLPVWCVDQPLIMAFAILGFCRYYELYFWGSWVLVSPGSWVRLLSYLSVK